MVKNRISIPSISRTLNSPTFILQIHLRLKKFVMFMPSVILSKATRLIILFKIFSLSFVFFCPLLFLSSEFKVVHGSKPIYSCIGALDTERVTHALAVTGTPLQYTYARQKYPHICTLSISTCKN